MNADESYVYGILKKNSSGINWKFFEVVDPKSGDIMPQSKKYPSLGYWVSYPDFECYEKGNLVVLLEVKGYYGFFNGTSSCVAVKTRNFESYKRVRIQEGVELRICFVIKKGMNKLIFWESIDNIIYFPKQTRRDEYMEKDYLTGKIIKKVDDFTLWDSSLFRTDEEGLSSI